MPIQPKKSVLDYEKFFSNEIKDFISNTIYDGILTTLNITAITPLEFIIGILGNKDCIGYKVINSKLSSKKIEDIYDKFFAISSENSLSTIKPGRQVDFSLEMKSLFMRANNERMQLKHPAITTEHVLLAFINPQNQMMVNLSKILRESISYDDAIDASNNMHEAFDFLTEKPEYHFGVDLSDMTADTTAITLITPMGVNPSVMPIDDILGGMGIMGMGNNNATKGKKSKDNVSYCTNLVEMAKKGNIDTIVGRKKEIKTILQTFNRRKRNNVMLVGDAGVGKTAIVEGIAKMIADDIAPECLRGYEIYSLNSVEIAAGTQFRGMFEDRINTMLKELKAKEKVILFIDNIHSLFSSQKNDYDYGSALSNALLEPNIKIIAATNPKSYHTTFDNNAEIASKFQKIIVDKPSIEECKNILSKIKTQYEKYHNVVYTDEAIDACVNLSNRYITDKSMPSSAIDILDEAGASKKTDMINSDIIALKRRRLVKLEKENAIKKDDMSRSRDIDAEIYGLKIDIAKDNEMPKSTIMVTQDDIYSIIANNTGIPVQRINMSEKKTIINIDKVLKKTIIGQDEAIDTVSKAIKRSKVGLYPTNRPIFSTLCIGNTGCGKTLLAKELAKEIFGDEKYLVRFDMSEYSDQTAVNKLIGASAGYIGYSEGGLLTEAVKNKKYAVVLIDEIEKANDEIFNLFLQVLDEGCLTDNTGQKVDFKNTILIMTSNIGAKRASTEKGIGFYVDDSANKKDVIEKELKNKFPPEFINRLDEVVYFNDLNDENLKDIIKLELSKLCNRVNAIKCDFSYQEDVVDYIFDIISKEKEYGARPIARAIQKEIENKITDKLLETDNAVHFNAVIRDNVLIIE